MKLSLVKAAPKSKANNRFAGRFKTPSHSPDGWELAQYWKLPFGLRFAFAGRGMDLHRESSRSSDDKSFNESLNDQLMGSSVKIEAPQAKDLVKDNSTAIEELLAVIERLEQQISDLLSELENSKRGEESLVNQLDDSENTINRYEDWAKSNGVDLPPDLNKLWDSLVSLEKAEWSGKRSLSFEESKRKTNLLDEISKWTGVGHGVLAMECTEQVNDYMLDSGEGHASTIVAPRWELLVRPRLNGKSNLVKSKRVDKGLGL